MKQQVRVRDKYGAYIGSASLKSANKAKRRWPLGFIVSLTTTELRVNVSAAEVPKRADNPIMNLDAYVARNLKHEKTPKPAKGSAGGPTPKKTPKAGKSKVKNKTKGVYTSGPKAADEGGSWLDEDFADGHAAPSRNVGRSMDYSRIEQGRSASLYMQQRGASAAEGSKTRQRDDYSSPETESWIRSVSIGRNEDKGAGHAITPASSSRSRAFEFEKMESSHSGRRSEARHEEDKAVTVGSLGARMTIDSKVNVFDRYGLPVGKVTPHSCKKMVDGLPRSLVFQRLDGSLQLTIPREVIPNTPHSLFVRLKEYCEIHQKALSRRAGKTRK